MDKFFGEVFGRPRPLTALFLTGSTGLNSLLLLFLFYSGNFAPFIGVLVALSALLAYGLWIGNNAAWALVIFGSVLRILQFSDLLTIGLAVLTIVVAFLPQTKTFYQQAPGTRSNLSLSLPRVGKFLGVIVLLMGILIAFAIFEQ
jgi:hypothetical protein